MSKKLNELRPFDLEAAKAGATLYDMQDHLVYTLAAEAGPDGDAGVRSLEGNVFTQNYRNLRMAPLCWVEDRPVYKGDVLWNKMHPSLRYDVDYVTEYGTVMTVPNETGSYSDHPESLTWTRPYLCLVEGMPVHVGSVLFSKDGDEVTVEGLWSNGDIRTTHGIRCGCVRWTADYLSWTKPVRKVKKEGWIAVKTGEKPESYASWCSHVCKTKEQAEAYYGDQPVCCVRIEWEEEA